MKEIDPGKLPPDERVQAAYKTAAPIEPMARMWTNKWTYATPKDQVAKQLTQSFHDLIAAEAAAPNNEDLFLAAGLVAHLAYNVDVEEAFDPAVQSLTKAHELAPDDYRPQWFLAINLCQSNEIQLGMEQLLALEDRTSWEKLPADFWQDYAGCATTALLPAHTLRAVDRAMRLGSDQSSFIAIRNISSSRYTITDAAKTYASHEAWRAEERDGRVNFTSEVCGLRFSTLPTGHIDIRDISKGFCTETIEVGPYESKTGQGTPTLAIVTRPAKPGESLDDFAQLFLSKYSTKVASTPPSCPVDRCVAFEIKDGNMYAKEGGGHFLAVAFAESAPDYPGLLFEEIQAPPKPKHDGKVSYFRPTPILHRLPGTLYTIVLLDSNETIFEKAKADYESLLKSFQVD